MCVCIHQCLDQSFYPYTHYLAQSSHEAKCDTTDSSTRAYFCHSWIMTAICPFPTHHPSAGNRTILWRSRGDAIYVTTWQWCILAMPRLPEQSRWEMFDASDSILGAGSAQGAGMPTCQIQTMTGVGYSEFLACQNAQWHSDWKCPGPRKAMELECPGLCQFQF